MREKFVFGKKERLIHRRERTISRLIEGGAQLILTSKQIEDLHAASNVKKVMERKPKTEVAGTFETPDQTKELNFQEFVDLKNPLFGSFYRATVPSDDPFQKMVYDTSLPFNGIKGRKFQDILVRERAGEKAVKAERNIIPISLNEWRYLFTQLREEKLAGPTYFLVQFDDGVVRSIEVTLDKSGGGPYGYALRIGKLSPEESFYGDTKPHIICPVEELHQ